MHWTVISSVLRISSPEFLSRNFEGQRQLFYSFDAQSVTWHNLLKLFRPTQKLMHFVFFVFPHSFPSRESLLIICYVAVCDKQCDMLRDMLSCYSRNRKSELPSLPWLTFLLLLLEVQVQFPCHGKPSASPLRLRSSLWHFILTPPRLRTRL